MPNKRRNLIIKNRYQKRDKIVLSKIFRQPFLIERCSRYKNILRTQNKCDECHLPILLYNNNNYYYYIIIKHLKRNEMLTKEE